MCAQYSIDNFLDNRFAHPCQSKARNWLSFAVQNPRFCGIPCTSLACSSLLFFTLVCSELRTFMYNFDLVADQLSDQQNWFDR